jgi:hypothetical protein
MEFAKMKGERAWPVLAPKISTLVKVITEELRPYKVIN